MTNKCKIRFTASEIKQLMENENIRSVNLQLIYTDDFIKSFDEKIAQGQTSVQIFADAGLPPKLIGEKRIERFTYRQRRKGETR